MPSHFSQPNETLTGSFACIFLCLCVCRREAKKIFETALMESRRMSMSFITPEHIILAVLSVGDPTSRRVFARCAWH